MRDKLAVGGRTKCQRLLTLCQIRKVRAGGGVLHGGQRGVDLERLGKVLGALDLEVVVADAANKKGTKCQRLLTLSRSGR